MTKALLPGIAVYLAVSPAFGDASAKRNAAASSPAAHAPSLFDEAMRKRAEAITPLRDDPDRRRETREQRRAIQARLRSETDPESRIPLALGWANWELADVAAPAATRWMIGYRTREDLKDLAGVARFAGRALDSAEKDIESLAQSADTAVMRRRARWRETINTLRLFAAAYEALARTMPTATAPAAVQEACRKAALGLAELRENEDPDTAAAARLWQAALLEAGDRSGRELAVLDLALVPPERLPYDFFSRILRCQSLLADGSYALVVALTLRMEERCDRWFGEDAKASPPAKLTLAAFRIKCLWQWSDAIRADDPEQADALRKRADSLAAADFPPGQETRIYRLERAIPVYVERPLPETRPPQRREAPATSRTTAGAASEPADMPASSPAARSSSE